MIMSTSVPTIEDGASFNNNDNASKWLIRRKNDFDNSKAQCLGKRDKSFAGRIDPHVVEICGIINEREDMYTTSSCAGRCFMYRGEGIKSTSTFTRFRISHEKIHTQSEEETTQRRSFLIGNETRSQQVQPQVSCATLFENQSCRKTAFCDTRKI